MTGILYREHTGTLSVTCPGCNESMIPVKIYDIRPGPEQEYGGKSHECGTTFLVWFDRKTREKEIEVVGQVKHA